MSKPGWTEDDVRALLANPYYAVTIASSLFGDHAPLINRAEWVKANVGLINQIGTEAWLNLLLDVLESGGLSEPPDAQGGSGGSSGPTPRRVRRLSSERPSSENKS